MQPIEEVLYSGSERPFFWREEGKRGAHVFAAERALERVGHAHPVDDPEEPGTAWREAFDPSLVERLRERPLVIPRLSRRIEGLAQSMERTPRPRRASGEIPCPGRNPTCG